MPSERVQRRIDRLLDEAEAAADANDWALVDERARMVLRLDPENADAMAFSAMVEEAFAQGVVATPSARQDNVSAGEEAQPEPERPLPDSFVDGRYRVTGFLGEGGRKQVYRARDGRLNREVAFAVIKTEGLDATGRERIQREAQAMGQLSGDPHIVTIHDVGETDGQPYIVSEYMAGGDVEALLAGADQHQLPLERVLAIADDVAQALAHAHAAGVVHRDLKPGNIWLTEHGAAKLGDFGLAFAAAETRMTTEGTMLGTVAYMPPEQALGNPATPQSDLYALGCVLYELVAGRPPFLGDDAVAVISQHLNTAPVAPSWNRPDCPPALEQLIESLLAKTPADRPAAADAVRAELARIDVSTPAPAAEHHNPLDRLARGVFVGREGEMERLRAAFDRSLGGHGELVMLVGEPGIGKTRTTYELETYAKMRGAQVHWGRIHEHSGAPSYWPWVQLGRSLGAALGVGTDPNATAMLGDGTGELVRLFPELRQIDPNLPELADITDPEAAQFRLFDAYATFLRNAATQVPLLLVLDDLHWADKPSLLLLQHVARELAGMRVCLVGTFRDTDLVRTHPLSETLAALNREAGFERLTLRGLTQDECAGYIRAAANVDPSPPVLRRIFEETEGNPFFLAEVVNLMAQEGTIDATSLSDIRIPDGVREALGRRLDRLSEDANALLQVAAVVGREFPYDTLALLSDANDDGTLRLLEEAIEARVIEELDRPGRYRFTHHLMQETLLNELSITRRIRIQGQIGDALERRYGDRADERAARLAQHFVEAATLSHQHAAKAIHYSQLAAQQAETQSGWADAAKHYENCVSLMEDTESPLSEAEQAGLLVALGTVARHDGDYRTTWRSLMRAVSLYQDVGDQPGIARATLEAMQMFVPGDRLLGLVEQALAGLDDSYLEALLRVRVLLNPDVSLRDREGEFERRVQDLQDRHAFPDVGALMLLRDATRNRPRGDNPMLISRQAREAHARFVELGLVRDAAQALWMSAMWTLIGGEQSAGHAMMRDAADYARTHRVRFYAENALQMYVDQFLKSGDFAAYDEHAHTLANMQGFTGPLSLATRHMLAGDTERAVRLLPDDVSTGGSPALIATLTAGRAHVLYHAGDVQAAHEQVRVMRDAVSQYYREPGLPGNIISNLADAVALLDDATAQAVYDEAVANPAFRSSPVLTSTDHLRGDLTRRFGRPQDADRWYRRGIEWAGEHGVHLETAQCHLGLAALATDAGDTAEALVHLDRAIDICESRGFGLYLQQAIAAKMELQGLGDADLTTSIDTVAASIDTARPDLTAQAAPDGTVTLLFSDIENSTARTAELGDAKWMDLLREHNAVVREQLAAHGGYEVKCMGDGFMLAFRSARDGLRCAIAMQRAFAARNAGAAESIRVRIGLHTGEAMRESDDFFGTHVNLAARIGGAAEGDEILVSGLLKALTESAGEFTFDGGRDLELKGITGPQRVYTVEWR